MTPTDAPAGWRRRGSGSGAVRRPGASPSLHKASKQTTTPPTPTQPHSTTSRASNQANERSTRQRKPASTTTDATPSRWREMRQSVRVKATLESPEICQGDARIADLCPEDREKVAKLVRRIVEVGTLQEEGEKEFQRQREVLEAEVQELRTQVKHDTGEIEEISEALRSATRKVKMFQERVLVLEESTDAEMRSRLDAEQTLDLLKLELDKLRALVRRQLEEMQIKTTEQQERFDAELQRVNLELKETHELLLQERHDRVLEKQRALDERLERSAAVKEEKPIVATPPAQTMEVGVTSNPATMDAPPRGLLDISSFLNTSVELPEKMKEIMEDWKQKMEETLAAAKIPENKTTEAVLTTDQIRDSAITVSTACQTDVEAPPPVINSAKKKVVVEKTVPVDAASDQEIFGGTEDERTAKTEDGFITPIASCRPMTQPESVTKRLDFDQFISKLVLESEDDVSNMSFEDDSAVVSVSEDKQQEDKVDQGENVPLLQGEHWAESENDMTEQVSESVPKQHDGATNAMPASKREKSQSTSVASQSAGPWPQIKQRNRRQSERNQSATQSVEGNGNDTNVSNLPDFSFLNVMNGSHTRNSHQVLDEPAINHASFNGIYEASLFDVVDAIEKTQQPSPPYHHQPDQARNLVDRFEERYPATVSSSPSTRVENLRQHVEARERLFFQRYDAVHPQDQVVRPQGDRHAAASSAIGDLAVFEEVKDLYAEDLFTSHRWGAFTANAQAATSLNQLGTRGFSECESEPRYNNSLPSRPLSPQELSVQISIERDMEELLLSENLPSRFPPTEGIHNKHD